MSESDVAARTEWKTYPHGWTANADGVPLWPAFADTLGAWARCKHCAYDAWGENLAAVGVSLVWHLYDEHPATWRAQYGTHRRPAEARPADLDMTRVERGPLTDETDRPAHTARKRK